MILVIWLTRGDNHLNTIFSGQIKIKVFFRFDIFHLNVHLHNWKIDVIFLSFYHFNMFRCFVAPWLGDAVLHQSTIPRVILWSFGIVLPSWNRVIGTSFENTMEAVGGIWSAKFENLAR